MSSDPSLADQRGISIVVLVQSLLPESDNNEDGQALRHTEGKIAENPKEMNMLSIFQRARTAAFGQAAMTQRRLGSLTERISVWASRDLFALVCEANTSNAGPEYELHASS